MFNPLALTFSLALASGTALAQLEGQTVFASGCPIKTPSCHNTTVVKDLCCFEAPGGLLLLTQFWDTNPSIGPVDLWTIHGLWNDFCDKGFPQNCDPGREISEMTKVLKDHGRTDLLNELNQVWLPNKGKTEDIWEHEWNKHGTCLSTLRPKCLSSSSAGSDAVAYLQAALDLWKTLPTFEILARAEIFPSQKNTYTYDQLTAAVANQLGVIPAFECNKGTNVIFQINYYYNLRGSVVDGRFDRIDAREKGSCPKTGGLWYWPKDAGIPPPAVTRTASPTRTATPPRQTGSRHEIDVVLSDGTAPGCLLSKGVWGATPANTCAGYTEVDADDGSFILTTSKGNCGISSGTLQCSPDVEATQFTWTSVDGSKLLTFDGSTVFSSAELAHGSTFQSVAVGDGPTTFSLVLKA